MKELSLIVATEFSRTPGVRTADESGDGNFSGEKFLAALLYPRFVEAVQQDAVLVVNLDGTAGYATSFLEAAFGGLVRGEPSAGIPPSPLALVKRHLQVIDTQDGYLEEEINEYMADARAALVA